MAEAESKRANTGAPEGFQQLSAAETTVVLKNLHENQLYVLFKFPGSAVIKMKTADKGWGQNILGIRPTALENSGKDQVVTGNFSIDADFFFFKAKVRIQKQQVHLQFVGEIFKLVRRKNSRLKIAPAANMYMVTKKIGDRQEFLRGTLQDISLTGCRVAIYSNEDFIKVGTVISGLIRYGSRKPIEVIGTIRHARTLTKDRYDQVFGVEFSQVEDLQRFQTWLLDLHREAFAKM